MPSLTPSHKFLLDENVRIELSKLLISEGFDVKLAPKSSADKTLASISLKEGRILVTNDGDFSRYSSDKVFSVVLLKIPQKSVEDLKSSFANLLIGLREFKNQLVILETGRWRSVKLGSTIK